MNASPGSTAAGSMSTRRRICRPCTPPRSRACTSITAVNELGWPQPPAPTYFWKSRSSLIGHKGHVIRPNDCKYLNYEGEIALVVRPHQGFSEAVGLMAFGVTRAYLS